MKNERNEMMIEVNESTVAETEVLDIAPVTNALKGLENPEGEMICTIPNDGTLASKVKIYNAINGSEGKISDHINNTLEITDVVAHPVQVTQETTGEIVDTVRIVLIDKDGNSYSAVSAGILNSLQKMFMVFGKPHWEEPIKVLVKQVNTRNANNKILTLEAVL